MHHILLKYRQRSNVISLVGFSSNTPFCDTWSIESGEIGWGMINVEIVWSDSGVNNEILLCNLVGNPKILHFRGSWVLFLYRIIGNSSDSWIIAVYWSGWLGVWKFFKYNMDDKKILALIKRSLSSASAADASTNHKRDVRLTIGPFNFIGCLSWGSYQRKRCNIARLFALGAPR